MKIFTVIFSILALVSIAFSFTKISWDTPFEGDSIVALIMIAAALCALALVYILAISKRIQNKLKTKR